MSASGNPAQPAFQCRDVSVHFGDVTALSDVAVDFAPGMIHAVVGQNGAGKTTFARVAAGLVRPDSGEVLIGGRTVRTGNVNEARQAGVELVHQSFALPPSFTVAEAMEFSAAGPGMLYSRRGLEQRWRSHLDSLDVQVDDKARIRDLPVETQQSVEIARALVADAKILILDEPTAVLSPSGIANLFDRIGKLKQRGVTVVLILHKIREVLSIADTVTVLRAGIRVEGPTACSGIDANQLAELIIGSSAPRGFNTDDTAALTGSGTVTHIEGSAVDKTATPMLDMRSVSTRPDAEGPALEDVSLVIQPHEIVGVAGVEGNGQRSLVRALSALSDVNGGSITFEGTDVTQVPLSGRRAAGLRVIPFERNVEGLSLSSALWENWSVRELLQKRLLAAINPATMRKRCADALSSWSVVHRDVGQKAAALSGGNAQKVILAREMDEDARLILAAQPTRGLDIGATTFVWQSLRAARERGCGILLISSDLDEIFDICDRVVVVLSGRIAGEFTAPYDITQIGAAMTGASR